MAHLSSVLVLAPATAASHAAGRRGVGPPPNAPAAVEWNAEKGRLCLRYHGTVLLDAAVTARDGGGKETRGGVTMQPAVTAGEKVEARVEGPVASVRIVPSATKVVNWRMEFAN